MIDKDIVSKLQKGDADIYEYLFRQYYQQLCFFSMKYVSDADEAEEIVQETFVKIWNKRSSISITSSLKSYLYQSVRNACLNFIKHNQVKLQYEKNQLYTQSELDSSDTLIALELENKISASLQKLPPERKKIFLMNRNEGLKYKEIAEKLGISIKTVENQMGKALKFLREELSEYIALLIYFMIEIIKI